MEVQAQRHIHHRKAGLRGHTTHSAVGPHRQRRLHIEPRRCGRSLCKGRQLQRVLIDTEHGRTPHSVRVMHAGLIRPREIRLVKDGGHLH